MSRSRRTSDPSAEGTLPPPPYELHRRTPTTLTMRAILEEGADLSLVVSEPFDVLFYRGVDAYLARDYAQALECFLRAQPLEVGTTVCRKNVEILRTLLERERVN